MKNKNSSPILSDMKTSLLPYSRVPGSEKKEKRRKKKGWLYSAAPLELNSKSENSFLRLHSRLRVLPCFSCSLPFTIDDFDALKSRIVVSLLFQFTQTVNESCFLILHPLTRRGVTSGPEETADLVSYIFAGLCSSTPKKSSLSKNHTDAPSTPQISHARPV